MKRVIVKGPALKLNGKWCYDKDTTIVSEDVYEKNKKYLDVVEEISEKKERTITIMVKDETIDLKELKQDLELYVERYKKETVASAENTNDAGNSADDNIDSNTSDNSDKELETLRERAKELGIKNTHNMKKETLIAKIKEIEDTEVEKENSENE